MDDFKPRWLGEYELLRPLGVGGMAEVFLSRTLGSQGFQKTVVVKRLLPQLAGNPEQVAMFVQEAKLTVQLQHANIVQVLRLEEHAGQPYIVMEYVHGKDLNNVLLRSRDQRAALPIDFGIHCLVETLKGLDYAHRARGPDGPLHLVHRDVTPSNVFVSFDGEVKLGDFGVAHKSGDAKGNELRGKVGYLAPEVVLGQPIDARADLFSAGVMLWEVLAQRRLFVAEHEGAVALQVVRRVPDPPSTHNPQVAHDLDLIAAKALAKNPDERFQTAQAFEEALADYLYARRMRWTRHRISEVMTALFPADAKPLDLPPPSPRADSRALDDMLEFSEATTEKLQRPRLPDDGFPPPPVADLGELPPPPVADFSEVTPWTESIELRLDDIVIDDTVKMVRPVDDGEIDRFYVTRRGRTEPTPVTVDRLIDLLIKEPVDVVAISLFARPALERNAFARLVYWDALAGLVEPDTRPALAHAFDQIGIVQLLYQVSMRRVSGLVVVESAPEERRRFIYLEQGVPQYIASDDPRDGLLAVMRDRKLLSSGTLTDILERVLGENLALDWALLSSTLREESEKVEHVFSAAIRLGLFAAFGWRRGQFRVYPNVAPPAVLTVRIPPLVDMLVDAVRFALPPDRLRELLAPHARHRVGVAAADRSRLAALQLKVDEQAICDLLDGNYTLDRVIQRCESMAPDSPTTALAVLYVLTETRIAQFAL